MRKINNEECLRASSVAPLSLSHAFLHLAQPDESAEAPVPSDASASLVRAAVGCLAAMALPQTAKQVCLQ